MYYKATVGVSEESLKSYLSNFYNEQELAEMDMQSMLSESLYQILSNEFSDYVVVDKNTVVFDRDTLGL